MHIRFVSCIVSTMRQLSLMTRLFYHLSHSAPLPFSILTIGTRLEAQDGLYLRSIGHCQLIGTTLAHSTLWRFWWSVQLLLAHLWFTAAKRGLNDYRGRQLLTLWCALDNVIWSGSPLRKLHVHSCTSICSHSTPSKSPLIREPSSYCCIVDLKQHMGLTCASSHGSWHACKVYAWTYKHTRKHASTHSCLLTGGASSRKYKLTQHKQPQ